MTEASENLLNGLRAALSDHVKQLARDPRRAQAVVAHRKETGMGIADAKAVVDAYLNTLPARREWRLTRGGEVLAVLCPDGRALFADLYAREGVFQPTPAFERVRALFERANELFEAEVPDDWGSAQPDGSWVVSEEFAAYESELDSVLEEIYAPGLFVESPDGQERVEIDWIRVRDGRAWWFPLYNSPRTVLPESGA